MGKHRKVHENTQVKRVTLVQGEAKMSMSSDDFYSLDWNIDVIKQLQDE